MNSGEGEMNPDAMTIINPRKVNWTGRAGGSNQIPPVLKSSTLPRLSKVGSAIPSNDKILDQSKLKTFAIDKMRVKSKR